MAICQGLTAKGKSCKSKVLENGYCRFHQDQPVPDIVPVIPEVQPDPWVAPDIIPETPKDQIDSWAVCAARFRSFYEKQVEIQSVPGNIPKTSEIPFTPEIQTAVLTPEDRVLRYRTNPRCPSCDAHPTVCMIRRKNYGFFKCRTCGHRFEVKK